MSSDLSGIEKAFHGIVMAEAPAARYNIAPTQDVAAIPNDGAMRLVMLRWGLIPHWAKDEKIGYRMINARAESLAEKPSFRDAYRKRRCLVIADGFYEWRKEPDGRKTPMYIRLKSGGVFGFAGLWEVWEGGAGSITSCTIITTESNELVSSIHDRMPVIVRPRDYGLWLDPGPRRPGELKDVLVPYPSEELTLYEVSPAVNSPSNDSPDCVKPASHIKTT